MASFTAWRVLVLATTVLVVVAGTAVNENASARLAPSIRQFEPDRLADLELRMWQAYYAKQNARLFGLLIAMLRAQYHYSWPTATVEAFHLARAAARFGNLRSNYESVLPDLEHAYATARGQVAAGFEPSAVARAELAWWVARRMPGHNSANEVGGLIRDEYALLYEVPPTKVERAALLRARAAALRDETAARPDWDAISALLRDSYRALHAAVTTPAGVVLD